MNRLILTKHVANSKLAIRVAIAAGVLAPVIINNISRLLDVWASLLGLAVALVVFLLTGCLIEYAALPNRTSKVNIQYVGIILGALVPGVIIDVTLDFYVRQFDRNLFLFEIIVWWIFAPLPILGGVALARTLFKFRTKEDNADKARTKE